MTPPRRATRPLRLPSPRLPRPRVPRTSRSVAVTRAASVVCGIAAAGILVLDTPRPPEVPLLFVVVTALAAAVRPEPRAIPAVLAAQAFLWVGTPHPPGSVLPLAAAALVLAQVVLLAAGVTAPPTAPLARTVLLRWLRRWALLTLVAALTWAAPLALAFLPSVGGAAGTLLVVAALGGVAAVTLLALRPPTGDR